MPYPCDCCTVGEPACALISVQFTGVSETAAQAGWNQLDLFRTIDGITNDGSQAGYTTTIGNTPSTTLRVTYTHSTPQNRVRGLRLWNQGGSDLNDADGLRNFTAEYYSGATLLATETYQGSNGGAAQSFFVTNSVELNAVDRVVLRTLDKQIGGNVAPEWRELQLLETSTVFPCRRRSGVLEWYDVNGNLVPSADVFPCDTRLVSVNGLTMNGAFFGDDPSGTAENMCNVVPAPATATGWAAPVSGCYDPIVGNPSFTWGPTDTVEMEYGNGPGGQASGAVNISFTPTLGTVTWPTNLTNMNPGEQRLSNVIGSSSVRARLTYLSGPLGASPSGSIRMSGGSTLGLHFGGVVVAAPIRFRLDFINA